MTQAFRLTERASLQARNTFRVPATARVLAEVDDAAALPDAFSHPLLRDGPPLVLGGGSNLLFAADPPGAVLALASRSIRIAADHGDIAIVRADAGVAWHALVLWTLDHGLAGLENLALIPGTVGAAPIQNVGAYGVEVCERIHAVEAFERDGRALRRYASEDCGFAYRDSRFKRMPDGYVVTAVEFALPRTPTLRLDYAGIGEELAAMGARTPTPAQVAEAVCRIRRRKLPDPAAIGNAGSFFKNPVVPAVQAQTLRSRHPSLPVFPLAPFPAEAALHVGAAQDDRRKLSAAWLIDACGWKGHRDGDAGVSDRHALVLVNHGDASGAQLLALARRIATSVHERFGVMLEPEPRIVGAEW